MNQYEAAENLVLRSRQGDQNAMAIIAMVAENAKKGNRKAVSAFNLIQSYISRNPVEPESTMGVEHERHLKKCVEIANFGVALTRKRVHAMAKSFGPQAKAFMFGFKNFRDLDKTGRAASTMHGDKEAIEYGRNVGIARNIQLARHPRLPVRFAFPRIAWELGE